MIETMIVSSHEFLSAAGTQPPTKKLLQKDVFFEDTFFVCVCALMLILSPLLFISHAKAASHIIAYDCYSPHCYDLNDWGGANGAKTSIFTNQLSSGNGFVTNEMWLGDYASTGNYWVEAGATSDSVIGNGAETLFWADSRPSGGYYQHIGPYLSSNDFGKFMNVTIRQTTDASYSASISGLPVASLSGASTSNSMSPNVIQVGMEISGGAGAYAPVNGYTNNQWLDSVGNWHYQGNNGNFEHVDAPAYGYWQHSPDTSSNGGDWRTCIHGAGC